MNSPENTHITTKCLARSTRAGKSKNYFTNHLCLTERKMAIKKGQSARRSEIIMSSPLKITPESKRDKKSGIHLGLETNSMISLLFSNLYVQERKMTWRSENNMTQETVAYLNQQDRENNKMKTYLFGYKSKQTSKRRGLKTVSVGEDAVEGAPNVLV